MQENLEDRVVNVVGSTLMVTVPLLIFVGVVWGIVGAVRDLLGLLS